MMPVMRRVTDRHESVGIKGVGMSRRPRLTGGFDVVDVPALIIVGGKGVMRRISKTEPGGTVLRVL